jgi:hypothetical protein
MADGAKILGVTILNPFGSAGLSPAVERLLSND